MSVLRNLLVGSCLLMGLAACAEGASFDLEGLEGTAGALGSDPYSGPNPAAGDGDDGALPPGTPSNVDGPDGTAGSPASDPTEPDATGDGSGTPSRSGDDSAPDAEDPLDWLAPSGPADYTPSPNNDPACPDLPPENPWGDCLGVPVYASCDYTDYVCICDWYHWICLGPVPEPGTGS